MDRTRCLFHFIRSSTPIDVKPGQVYPLIAGRSLKTEATPPLKRREARSKFSYRIAVASVPKNRRFDKDRDVFRFSHSDPSSSVSATSPRSSLLSEAQPRSRANEDAFFVSGVGGSGDIALGVADGVGGWASEGVDPSHFSHALCRYMARRTLEFKSTFSEPLLAPMDLIQRGYTDVIDDPKITAGGSTACVALVHENGRINIANLGDSGFMHLRQQHIRSRFQPQLHDFNTPYQLSLVPPELRARSEMFGGRMLIDSPSDARQYTCWVRSGDVLIFATDGLWDNFEYWEVQKLVYMEMTRRRAWVTDDEKGIGVGDALRELTEPVDSETKAGGSSLQEMLASTIVRLAKLYSAHPLKDSPFARMLRRHNPLEGYRGGKLDDICVMVVIPVETTTPAVDD